MALKVDFLIGVAAGAKGHGRDAAGAPEAAAQGLGPQSGLPRLDSAPNALAVAESVQHLASPTKLRRSS
jgi:hypothetical protein